MDYISRFDASNFPTKFAAQVGPPELSSRVLSHVYCVCKSQPVPDP